MPADIAPNRFGPEERTMRRIRNVVVISLAAVAIVATGCARRPSVMQAAAPPPAGQVEAKPSEAPAQPRQPSRAAERSTSGGRMENARPAPSEFVDVADLKEIHFDFDKYDIRKTDAQVLNGNAEWLKSHEDQLLLIEGHCDERGTNEYNLALGERRAKSTMDYLVSRGIQSNRISVVSYGEERPACRDHNAPCWAKNRRAHFLAKPR
jgi:peptidoglycan-associated lipoprotein